MRASGPDFAIPVAKNGYAWWYIDAISDDGANALTIIAFVGSVFSPYYKWARRKAIVDPAQHCALNVALYGKPRRWAMTERNAAAIARDENTFRIGPSALRWSGEELVIDISEICAPIPLALRGRVTVRPHQILETVFELHENGAHRWRPIAPLADVRVEMERPDLRWSGRGYFDHNIGDEPVEEGFVDWVWSRAHEGRNTIIRYEANMRRSPQPQADAHSAGSERKLSLKIGPDGTIETIPTPPVAQLSSTPIWRMPRITRAHAQEAANVLKTCEDTPFYSRSLIETSHEGKTLTGFHESLDLDRFSRPVVQAMLPFRMPRRQGRAGSGR